MKTANAEMALAAVIDSSEMSKIRDAADQAIKELEENYQGDRDEIYK